MKVKMHILISTNYKGSWPYIPEMVDGFNKKGISCDIYDTSECRLIYNHLKSEKYIIHKYLIYVLLKIPKVKKYIRILLNKIFYIKNQMNYDIHTIHYLQLFYFDFITTIKVFAKQTVGVAWGSDIYRINVTDYKKLSLIINSLDYLIATKPMIEFLMNREVDISTKIKANQLYVVSKSIDNLAKLIADETIEFSKEQLNIPKDSFIITFGYNASVLQQHEYFINTLKEIKQELPNNILFLLPMTYREDRINYIVEIENQLRYLNLNYIIFNKFLNEKDILRIRRVTDIAINLQKTDALSSSMREHLFANNLLIVGSWLPYDVFEEMGIYFIKTDLNNFKNTLIDCLKIFDKQFQKCKNNSDLIYQNFSFENNIDKWIDFYKSILKEQ